MTFEEWWEQEKFSYSETGVYSAAVDAWNAAIKAAADVAKGTVCDVHLPTGVRIYGMPASVAILELLESK